VSLETIELPVGELEPHPQNAKTHDLELLKESITRFGQYRSLVVQTPRGSRKRHRILAGHGTYFAMRELGWETVSVHPHDVDDDTAKRIVLMDNRAPELGGFNNQALAELLSSMHGDFSATGYEQEDLDELMKLFDEPDPSPAPPAGPQFRIVIECDSEEQRQELLDRLESEGLKVKAMPR
jgi:ParB-like chromosome segregation protein Spo0J